MHFNNVFKVIMDSSLEDRWSRFLIYLLLQSCCLTLYIPWIFLFFLFSPRSIMGAIYGAWTTYPHRPLVSSQLIMFYLSGVCGTHVFSFAFFHVDSNLWYFVFLFCPWFYLFWFSVYILFLLFCIKSNCVYTVQC